MAMHMLQKLEKVIMCDNPVAMKSETIYMQTVCGRTLHAKWLPR